MDNNYFDAHDQVFEKFENDGLNNSNDLTLKSKINLVKNITLSTVSVVNKKETQHEYNIEYLSDNKNIIFNHKEKGGFKISFDTLCLNTEQFQLRNYSKFKFDLNEKKNSEGSLIIRLIQGNHMLALGFEDLKYKQKVNVLTSYITKYFKKDDFTFSISTYGNFDFQNNFFKTLKFLAIVDKQDLNITSYFLLNTNREFINSKDDDFEPYISNNVDFTFKMIRAFETKKLGLKCFYDFDSKIPKTELLALYSEPNVEHKLKLSSDGILTYGISSKRNDITINFAAKTTLVSDAEKDFDTLLTSSNYWANMDFGLTINFDRT